MFELFDVLKLAAVLVVVVLLLLFIALFGVIKGALKFVLWTEPRLLGASGALGPSKVHRLPGSRFAFIRMVVDGGVEKLFRDMSSDGNGQVYPPLVCVGGDFTAQPYLFVFDADAVRDVLTQHDRFFAKQPATYDVLAPLLGRGLVLSAGDLWRRQRKLLTPLFHFVKLRAYTQIENEEAARLVDVLAAKGGENVEPIPLFASCMQRIVMRAVFSDHRFDLEEMATLWDQVNDAFRPWILAVSFLPLPLARLVPGGVSRAFRCIDRARDLIGAAVDAARASEDGACDDIVGQMAQLSIDRELIVDECVTFLFAGRDTVSHTMGFVLYFLAQNAGVQEELLREVESVCGSDAVDDAAINELKLHGCVVRETLRLRPALPNLNRVVSAPEGVTLAGVHIPQDTIVSVGALGIQRAREHWGDDSCEFRPARWLEESQRTRHPFSWLPFNAGTRSCIGKSLAVNATTVMLAHIVRRFKIVGDVQHVTTAFTGTFGPVGLDRIRFIERSP
jgi:cytochrome P450